MVLHPWNTTQTEIFFYAARRNASTADGSIPRVPKGNYTMLVFDGERNGLLSEQPAIVTQNVTITNEGGFDLVEGNFF